MILLMDLEGRLRWYRYRLMLPLGLIYPDYKQANLDGLRVKELDELLQANLEEVNHLFPNYSHITHLELMPEDFEMTPKGSIKRYLYQRNRPS